MWDECDGTPSRPDLTGDPVASDTARPATKGNHADFMAFVPGTGVGERTTMPRDFVLAAKESLGNDSTAALLYVFPCGQFL